MTAPNAAPSGLPADFAAALRIIDALPLTPDEKAAAVRRVLAGRVD